MGLHVVIFGYLFMCLCMYVYIFGCMRKAGFKFSYKGSLVFWVTLIALINYWLSFWTCGPSEIVTRIAPGNPGNPQFTLFVSLWVFQNLTSWCLYYKYFHFPMEVTLAPSTPLCSQHFPSSVPLRAFLRTTPACFPEFCFCVPLHKCSCEATYFRKHSCIGLWSVWEI